MTGPQLDDTVHGAILFRLLGEKWASLPADDGGEELALQFVRAAYGRGYVDALEQARA